MKNIFLLLFTLCLCMNLTAQELVYQDKTGTIRWKQNKQEVALFGANYCLPSACDYRAAGYVGGDRKKMIQEDLDHFKRMGWQGLRICFWGDWENSDAEGNLIDNDHLDLMDYLIAEATKRDIYMLFSPIVTYDSQFPEMNDNSNTGFAKTYPKATLTHDKKAIQCQENYMKNILNHVNRYTGKPIKEESHILFVELINEPTQFPSDIPGMVKYINRLYKAIKSTGCKKLTFYNLSQDFNVAPAIRQSQVDGASYAWYPQGLNNGYTFTDNGLHFVDRYPQMANIALKGKSKIVYEFDASDTNNGYMYPAMVREYRHGGVQFAAMFSYDMHRTASRNLGWQTHFFNMVYSPAKAIGGMIAAEIMRRIPRGTHAGFYPENNQFGDFRVSYEERLGQLNAEDMFYYSNHTSDQPKDKNKLKHIAGVGSSTVVEYDGTGIYFLDKIKPGTWLLEVYPDIMEEDDPFKRGNPARISRQAVYIERNMRVNLPDLQLSMAVLPGKYTFENNQLTKKEELAGYAYYMKEKPKKWQVKNLTSPEMTGNQNSRFVCDIYGPALPEKVCLFLMTKPFRNERIEMKHQGEFRYVADVDLSQYAKGKLAYHIGIQQAEEALLFPEGTYGMADQWSYYEQETYTLRIVEEKTPLTLLDENDNWRKIRRSRTQRSPQIVFTPVFVGDELEKAYQLSTPSLEPQKNYRLPCDVTFSHYIAPRMNHRGDKQATPQFICVEAQGLGDTNKAIINLVDQDGRGYGYVFPLKADMERIVIPVSSLVPTKAVMLPQDFPGINEYWYPESVKENSNKPLDWKQIAYVQISLREEIYSPDKLKDKGVIVKKIQLLY